MRYPVRPAARPWNLPPALLLLLAAGFAAGCSPSMTPLYRDFATDRRPVEASALRPALEAAFRDAGWEIDPAPPPSAVATRPRTIENWGLYRVVVSLEVVPFQDRYVRLFVHPYRYYLFGGRGKVPFLPTSLKLSVLSKVTDALERQGFAVVGTPFEHDRVRAQ